MMKKSTLLFLVNNFNYSSSHKSNLPGSGIENDSTEIESVDYIPSAEAICSIMDFARVYDTLETKTAGYVEMILN